MKNLIIYTSVISTIFLASCATDIEKIKNNPQEYKDKNITIRGEVKNVINVLLKKGFFIQDETGEIFVLTENALPTTGEQKVVKGKVIESPQLLGNSMIIIQENTK